MALQLEQNWLRYGPPNYTFFERKEPFLHHGTVSDLQNVMSKYEVVLFQSLVRGSDELISKIEDVKIYSIWSSWNCLLIAIK